MSLVLFSFLHQKNNNILSNAYRASPDLSCRWGT